MYNGWKNRATWNVALWLSNDEGLYTHVCNYLTMAREQGWTPSYTGMVKFCKLSDAETPDGYGFTGRIIDYPALTAMLKEWDK